MQAHTYEIERKLHEAHWWFRVRRRLVTQVLSEVTLPAPPAEARALDLGCGTGSHGPVLAEFAQVAALDRAAAAFAAAQPAYRWRMRADATRLPVRDGALDLVLAADLLEHLDDDLAALGEIHRALRPGGVALFLVPAFGWLWGVQDDVSEHRRRYTAPILEARVRAAGFDVERATYFNTFLLPPIFLARYLMRRAGIEVESENVLTPGWSNVLLEQVFGLELPLLRRVDLPVGVSFLCLARRAGPGSGSRRPHTGD